MLKQSLDLGRERPAIAGARVVQRLFPDAVACEEQAITTRVPHGEGEHAVEALKAGIAPALVRSEHDLGVAASVKGPGLALELFTERRVVVQLPVVTEDDAAVVVGHRLVAMAKVD